MTVHVLKTWGKPGEAATTICRMTGRQSLEDPNLYIGTQRFVAVHPSHPTQGATCKDCRRSMHAKKTDKQTAMNMRLP